MPNVVGEIYGPVDLLWDSQNASMAQRSLVSELQFSYWPEKNAVSELRGHGDCKLF